MNITLENIIVGSFESHDGDTIIITVVATVLAKQRQYWKNDPIRYTEAGKHLETLQTAVRNGIPDEEDNPKPLQNVKAALKWVADNIEYFWV